MQNAFMYFSICDVLKSISPVLSHLPYICISFLRLMNFRTMKHMKYFLICIFTSIPLWCVMLCRGVEYQAAFSSDQPSLQDNLSCLSISIHCVWTALGELHPEARAACAAHNDFWCKLWCWNLNREQLLNMHHKKEKKEKQILVSLVRNAERKKKSTGWFEGKWDRIKGMERSLA